MTRTEELLALAEAAEAGPWKIIEDSLRGKDEAWCYWHRVGPFDLMGKEANDNDKFISAANPETIKQLCLRQQKLEALVRLQHKAILEYNKYTRGVMIPQTRFQGQEAIAAFNKFEQGGE